MSATRKFGRRPPHNFAKPAPPSNILAYWQCFSRRLAFGDQTTCTAEGESDKEDCGRKQRCRLAFDRTALMPKVRRPMSFYRSSGRINSAVALARVLPLSTLVKKVRIRLMDVRILRSGPSLSLLISSISHVFSAVL